MIHFRYYMLACGLFILVSCSNTKYLPKGDMLYIGANVKIDSDSLNRRQKKVFCTELNALPRPKPNLKSSGLRLKLFAFNIAGTPKKTKGMRHWLKHKIGEPPVLASSVNLQLNKDILQNRLQNRGFFHTTVISDTISRKKRMKVTYIAIPGFQYRIKTVIFSTDSSELGKAVTATYDKSLLKPGDMYNLNVILSERDRIDQSLKEQGFYYFSAEYLLVKVDSTIGNHQVNLYLTIKEDTPKLARNSYFIGDITIYPNYNLTQNKADTVKNIAVLFNGFYVIDKDSTFKPSVFSRSMFLKSGMLYNRKAHNLSINRLISIGCFKLVTNRFVLIESAARPTLNVFYYLTPLPRQSIRTELLATTKSNNLTGSELSVSWHDRNIFGGAEQLIIKAYGGFEMQLGGTQLGYNTFRLGGESSLSLPKLVIPLFHFKSTNAFVPRTKFTIGYEILNKPQLYTLKSFRALVGYNWKESIRKEHELNLISINFAQPGNITSKYQDLIKTNPILAKTIERQFIIGTTYSFTYTDQLEVARKNKVYFNGNIDLAGNTLGLIQAANYKTGDTATIFGLRYSQYAKFDADFRYYLKTGRESRWVNRIFAGVGIPRGNSSELPFIKQYFAGGTNSNRAFMARSIGPGTYLQDASSHQNFFLDQSGDLKLELNSEFRIKLAGIVNAALFVDASNVWLYNNDLNKPGGVFSKKIFNELAIGNGVGLRFDFSFIVLRTDFAFPIHKPWLAKGDRWVFDRIDISNKQWRKENLVFNLAIGYPF